MVELNEDYHNVKFDIYNVYSFPENRNVMFKFHSRLASMAGQLAGQTLIITYSHFFSSESKMLNKLKLNDTLQTCA